MARVLVHAADLSDGRITRMQVQLGALPRRTIDRDTAISWMADHHSFIPVVGGAQGMALQLVEIPEGDEVSHVIRHDNDKVDADALPALPSVPS